MKELKYSKYDVLVIHGKRSGITPPRPGEIEILDAKLFVDNNALLIEIMTENGLIAEAGMKAIRSTILLYSHLRNGAQSDRIQQACDYYKAVNLL